MENSNFETELFLEVDANYFGNDFSKEDALLVYGVLRAVVEEDLEKLKNFLFFGKTINVNDNKGNTPLHVAVIKNNMNIIDFLLNHEGIEIDARNFSGETPLLTAIIHGKVDVAKKLICFGANVNIPNFEEVTALHLSVTNPSLAHLLIQNGAYLDATDYSGDTPLHDATAEECLETVCMLLYYNADANISGVNNLTPFMKAIISKNVEIQLTFLEYVIDFNIKTYDHISTLALALTYNSPFVEEIILGGANVNYAYGYDLVDAFSLCLQYPNAKNFKLIWERLKYDGDDMSLGSVLWRVSGTLRKHYFKQYIQIILESDNLSQVVESVGLAEDFYMVIVRFCDFFHQLSLKQLTKLTCRLLTYGYSPTSFDMSKLFLHYGYCELFKILLHMDIKHIGQRPPDTSRIIYDIDKDIYVLLDEVVANIGVSYLHNTIYQLIDYCIYPKLIIAYLDLKREDYVTGKILTLPRVPSLLELARNKTRQHLIVAFNIKCSQQLYTLINHIDILSIYKKILTFERKLYISNYVYRDDSDTDSSSD